MSFWDQWKDTKSAWNDSQSPASPGARFGLMFDPSAYALDLVGKGDKYRDFIKKTGDESNKTLSSALGTDDSNGWVGNKPASTIGMLIGGGYAGSGMFGGGAAGGGASGGSGMFGNMFGGGSGQGLGIFSNGGAGGMAGVGGGNAGALANAGGIGGGAGMGAAGSAAGPAQLGLSGNWQQYMKAAQGMPGMQGQQQQDTGPKPYLWKGKVVWM